MICSIQITKRSHTRFILSWRYPKLLLYIIVYILYINYILTKRSHPIRDIQRNYCKISDILLYSNSSTTQYSSPRDVLRRDVQSTVKVCSWRMRTKRLKVKNVIITLDTTLLIACQLRYISYEVYYKDFYYIKCYTKIVFENYGCLFI